MANTCARAEVISSSDQTATRMRDLFQSVLGDTRPDSRMLGGWHGQGCGIATLPRRQSCFFTAATGSTVSGSARIVDYSATTAWAEVWRPTIYTPFKRYRLYSLRSACVGCDHCWRKMGYGHLLLRYGDGGNFVCCLHCVRWRLVPKATHDAYRLSTLTEDSYRALVSQHQSTGVSQWMPIGHSVTDPLRGHGVVVWIDPVAPDERVAVFFTRSAALSLLVAANPILGEACSHARDPDDAYREYQRATGGYGEFASDPKRLQAEFDRMLESDLECGE